MESSSVNTPRVLSDTAVPTTRAQETLQSVQHQGKETGMKKDQHSSCCLGKHRPATTLLRRKNQGLGSAQQSCPERDTPSQTPEPGGEDALGPPAHRDLLESHPGNGTTPTRTILSRAPPGIESDLFGVKAARAKNKPAT